jgi:hypothetical protein
VRLVPPSEGLSAALEWFPDSGAALIATSPGGVERAIHEDGDLVLNLTSPGFTFTWLNPVPGYFGIEARRLPLSDHVWTPDANIVLRHQSTTSQFPWQSYAWHQLEVNAQSSSSPVSAELHVSYRGDGTHAQISRYHHWPSQELTLSEALDSTLLFATHPEAPWTGRLSAQSADGVDHASANLTNRPWLETIVEGPGQLRFWSRGHLEWQVNEVIFSGPPNAQQSLPEPSEWALQQVALPLGTHSVRWFKTSSLSALDQVSYAPNASLLPFDTWALLNDLEGDDARPDADPNGDGLSNRAAWAFGLSPTAARNADDEARLPEGDLLTTLLGDCLEMEFYRRMDSSEDYLPKFSHSPGGPWTALYDQVEVEDLGNGWQRIRVRDRIPVPGKGQRFGRVEISDQ